MVSAFSQLTFRPLEPEEIPAARAHLERLDRDDQYRHFHQPMDKADYGEWQMRAGNHTLIGCFRKGTLIGLAEFARHGDEGELALSVDAEHRGQGIGTELLERACIHARGEGMKHLAILISRGDHTMIDMAVRHDGFTVSRRGDSLLMPGRPHALLRWLMFDLDSLPDRSWFGRAVRSIRKALGHDEGHTTADLSSRD